MKYFLIFLVFSSIQYRLFGQVDEKPTALLLKLWKESEKKDIEHQLEALNNLGEHYSKRKVLDSALYWYYKGLRLAEKYPNQYEAKVSIFNTGLGNIYQHLKDYDKALVFFNKSLAYEEKHNNINNILLLYNNLGIVFKEKKEYETALKYYEKAEALLEKTDKINSIIVLYNNKANLLVQLGKNSESIKILEKAWELCEKDLAQSNKIPKRLIASTALNLAGAYLVSNQVDNRIELLLNFTQKVAQETKNYLLISESLKSFSLYFEKQNNLLESLKYYKQYDSLQKIILNEEKLKQIAEMQTKYETENKNQELIIAKKNANFNLLLSVSLSVILAFAVVLVIVLLKAKKTLEKQKLTEKNLLENQINQLIQQKENWISQEINELIEQREELKMQLTMKEQELLSVSMVKEHQKELVNKLQEYIKIANPNNEKDKEQIKKAQKTIEELKKAESEWEDFNIIITNIYHDFFDNLEQKYPNLTSNDLKLCAYLKMQLDNQKIADIFGISVKSVEMKKYRLKKKMQLDTNQDFAF
jgi:DNA-binding CsgD family transcriptional regulator